MIGTVGVLDYSFVNRISFKSYIIKLLNKKFKRRPIRIAIFAHIPLPKKFDFVGVHHQ